MIIKEISILSEEEFEYFKPSIPTVDAYCWLRSPGETDGFNVVVNNAVGEDKRYFDVFACSDRHVRPTMKVCNDHGYQNGDRVELFGMTWTVLTSDNNICLILCDQTIAKRRFDSQIGRVWESSALKKWLRAWVECMTLGMTNITVQC